MSKKDNEVAVKNEHAVVAVDNSMFEDDAGSGFENADAASFAIPFLSILQSGSPQVKKSDGAYIKGAEEGMLFNSVSQVVVDGEKGLTVLPCYYKRVFIKWAPRDAGGGYLGEFLPTDPIVRTTRQNDKGQDILPDGNLLVETRVHYVLVLTDDGAYSPAVISMSSTQAKKSKQWMSKMDMIKFRRADSTMYTPPMYSHTYRITTVPEKNDQGSWFGWRIGEATRLESRALLEAAKEFKRQIAAGEIKEQLPQSTTPGYINDVENEKEF